MNVRGGKTAAEVDVKARDDGSRQFQVEIQLLNHRDLLGRILYGWADLYSQQLRDGDSYRKLQPTYARPKGCERP